MLITLLKAIKNAGSITDVRKAASEARKVVKNNPKPKGEKEKAALNDIKSAANNQMASVK